MSAARRGVIPALTLEARIKRRLRAHLRELGFVRSDAGLLNPPASTKEALRSLHRIQRASRLKAHGPFIGDRLPQLIKYFASGSEVHADAIKPRLQLIKSDTQEADLFRLASLTWSVPVSQGYGRRMRFLVWDESNDKLIGLIALGDPPFNIRTRDDYIGWNPADRKMRLVDTMDAYVLGAVPPYNLLLGGKLVACLVRSQEIRQTFNERYGSAKGIISRKRKHASLVLVTTSSALGSSSVYNRLKLAGLRYFEPIGFTAGWGHFHIPDDLFDDIRTYLERHKHRDAAGNEFGDGPNWRLRAIKSAFQLIGLDPDLLRHGAQRQVFACQLASNALRVLRGDSSVARYGSLLSAQEVGRLAIERWMLPRSRRRPEYLAWKAEWVQQLLEPSLDGSISRGNRTATVV